MFGSQFQTQPFGQSTPGYYPHMTAQQQQQQHQQQQQQQNQFAWMQYQQMLQAQQFYGQQQHQAQAQAHASSPASEVGPAFDSRRRTSSTPQRPQHVTYNDTFRRDQQQHQVGAVPAAFPVGPYAGSVPQLTSMRSFNGQPMAVGQFGQVASSGHSASSSVSSAGGFHPYRRTQRGTSDIGTTNSQTFPSSGATATASPAVAAPRIRTGSTASNASAREASSPMLAAERKRGGSIPPSSSSPGFPSAPAAKNAPPTTSLQAGLSHLRGVPPRTNSQSSIGSDASSRTATAGAVGSPPVHHRSDSSTSIQSINTSQRGQPPSVASSKKPSPLSRQAAKDDDEEAVYGGSDDDRVDGGRSTPMPGYAPKASKKTGLSSKLRKALSFSNMNDIQDNAGYGGSSAAAAARRPQHGVFGRDLGGLPNSSGDTNASTGSTRSTSPPRTPDNGAAIPGSSAASITSRRGTRPPLSNNNEGKRSIFNRKFNSSTDNISISSTVSSASVMLRKVGNLGKLARRHSLMGLTNMFNKDKEREGRDGMHADSFGNLPAASDDSAINTKSKKASKSKKGTPATASITHATVELESARVTEAGMTPAASYVRQHQLQMQAQAEAEARAARERQESEAKAREAGENRQKMIEKEKERLKSKRGWRKKFSSSGGSISSISSEAPTGLEITYAEPDEYADGVDAAHHHNAEPLVSAAPPQLSMQYGEESGFDASFDSELLEPPHMPAAGGLGGEDSGDEYETDSLRHWGEGIERSRASAAQCKNYKGILKKTASTPDLSLSSGFEKPFAGRIRANSYDAPQASATSSSLHGAASTMTHISSSTAGVERLDGLGAKTTDSPVSSRPASRSSEAPPRSVSPGSIQHTGGVLGHHSNSSMPTLSLMMDPSADFLTQRSVTAPMQGQKKLSFAEDLIFHSTWPATVYDRRGEQATCNRLTPLLAQRIKEELNTYKMEEMAVAPSSRIYTHFFV
ncbi:hypothetical protein EX895_002860 [Sporisorium graminicola]|uniref:Bud neck involved protein n=1 Tax=Sporisorium graminicola TaxID=280036 RepID=A0A4U7KUG1_9BASI|nr:hypothetical protein EX895_002860 [Sporisorium graminicola]TKY88150.1 hypothetical protein EX895_002860 [Sporisorium graminicola]